MSTVADAVMAELARLEDELPKTSTAMTLLYSHRKKIRERIEAARDAEISRLKEELEEARDIIGKLIAKFEPYEKLFAGIPDEDAHRHDIEILDVDLDTLRRARSFLNRESGYVSCNQQAQVDQSVSAPGEPLQSDNHREAEG